MVLGRKLPILAVVCVGLIALAAVLPGVAAHGGCGTPDPTPAQLRATRQRLDATVQALTGTTTNRQAAAEALIATQRSAQKLAANAPVRTIDVYIYILGFTSLDGEYVLDVSDADIAAQMKVCLHSVPHLVAR